MKVKSLGIIKIMLSDSLSSLLFILTRVCIRTGLSWSSVH